jgi:hypothetical protein
VSGVEQNPGPPGNLASEGAAAAAPPFSPSLATLLATHILRDGELVLLILKPSLWFVLLSSLRFIAGVLILTIAAKIFDSHLPGPNRDYLETGLTIIAARLMWATLQWMGRLYILTDLRILCVWGIFNVAPSKLFRRTSLSPSAFGKPSAGQGRSMSRSWRPSAAPSRVEPADE